MTIKRDKLGRFVSTKKKMAKKPAKKACCTKCKACCTKCKATKAVKKPAKKAVKKTSKRA